MGQFWCKGSNFLNKNRKKEEKIIATFTKSRTFASRFLSRDHKKVSDSVWIALSQQRECGP